MIFENLEKYGCEEIIFFQDKKTDLKAIVALHDTTLGPAFGGTRLWNYHNEEEALTDVLRLAKAMSRKASITGLDCGGGKAVIIADPRNKTEAMIKAYAQFVDRLQGKLLTGEDVGIDVKDTVIMKKETKYIVGASETVSDPSIPTAYGVIYGMMACAKEVFGSSQLSGLTIAIQGVGHVGYNLARELHKDGVKIIASDMIEERTKRVADEFGAKIVSTEEIYSVDCDIFSPCALGAIINEETIPKLKCKVVAGSANNQLKEDAHGDGLHKRGILYAPDYLINAGGLISAYMDWKQNTVEEIMKKLEEIGDGMEKIISTSKKTGEPTYKIAHRLADERLLIKKRELGASKLDC